MGKLSAIKKQEQLGIPPGTASNQLKKRIIFSLIERLGENVCFQCGEKIETETELSIEHKVPYLDSEDPKGLFFDLNNIAFSHLSCNCKAARQTREVTHPSLTSYRYGCRCDECKELQRKAWKKHDLKRRMK